MLPSCQSDAPHVLARLPVVGVPGPGSGGRFDIGLGVVPRRRAGTAPSVPERSSGSGELFLFGCCRGIAASPTCVDVSIARSRTLPSAAARNVSICSCIRSAEPTLPNSGTEVTMPEERHLLPNRSRGASWAIWSSQWCVSCSPRRQFCDSVRFADGGLPVTFRMFATAASIVRSCNSGDARRDERRTPSDAGGVRDLRVLAYDSRSAATGRSSAARPNLMDGGQFDANLSRRQVRHVRSRSSGLVVAENDDTAPLPGRCLGFSYRGSMPRDVTSSCCGRRSAC